jgi:methyltransferase (TIGR00027 family)
MSINHQKTTARGDPLSAAIFITLNILLFPISLLGYVIWVGKGILAKRGSGVSGTAQGPLSARYLQHNLGTRRDEASNRLMQALPGVPPLGLRLSSGPLLFAHRVSGYVPKAFRYPFEGEVPPGYMASARQTFFDTIVDRYLTHLLQFVILGAGFDTRAYRLPKTTQVRCYEVDTPQTQAIKRQTLEKAEVDASGVTFVAADFEKEDWLVNLVGAGFDPDQPALFLLEGVIIYLDREAVENTFRKIASLAKGSVVAFDFYTSVVFESQELYWRYARATTKAAGEPLRFGFDSTPPSSERLAEFLSACGLSLDEQRMLGQETEGKRAWGGFATAIVK